MYPVVPLQMEAMMSDASSGIAEEPFPENDLMNLKSYPSLDFLLCLEWRKNA
jgi:hypothetical protein